MTGSVAAGCTLPVLVFEDLKTPLVVTTTDLLTGTPVLADTEGFLRILHLLDPVVFPLDDLAGFERRVQSRQLVAEIAASLQPENVLAMEDDLDRLRDTFGDDSTLMKRVDALRPIVQSLPEEDDEHFLAALGDLRAHLSETYKLHRRVLRNRRKAVPWATPQRKGLQTLAYASRWQSERHRVIDDLRAAKEGLRLAPLPWPPRRRP